MKVSVIIPAYNEAERISFSLEKILAQNYADLEVIVVDNASTDNTAEIASKFPVKIVREENKGTMWACERGRKNCSGDVIVRMDADCLPEEDWLSKGVSFFADPKVTGVSGPYDYYDAGFFFRYISLYFQKIIYTVFNFFVQWPIKFGGVMIGGNSFMKADALKAAGGFNTDFIFYGDDTEMAKRLSRFGEIVYSPSLVMKTSARRFKKEGLFFLPVKYIYYFFKYVFKR